MFKSCGACGLGYTVLYDMRQVQIDIRHSTEINKTQNGSKGTLQEDFVLEKSIFNNIFEKDIRRVFIYKKAERLAKALQLIAPAFKNTESLRDRINTLAISIIDASLLPPASARSILPRELLALSSMISIAQTSGLLSTMNAELVIRETHALLQEVALYEDPRLSFDDAPTLSDIAKGATSNDIRKLVNTKNSSSPKTHHKEGIKDTSGKRTNIKDRRDAVLSVIKDKRKASIRDISTLIRGVSEKTIQRELSVLINEGIVLKMGERRWSTYSLA